MTERIGELEFYMTDAGRSVGKYDPHDGTYVFCREDVSEAEFNAYIAELKNRGYSADAEYSLGKNKYISLSSKEIGTYVSYLADAKELRAYAEPQGFSAIPPAYRGGEENGGVTLWQLEVDSAGTRMNGGQTYVIKLSDGSFVLIDSGYWTEAEADRIYDHLRANTKEGEKPRIAAWFLTHMHGDHYGGMIKVSEKYNKDIILECFCHNGFKTQGVGVWEGMTDEFYRIAAMWESKPPVYNKIHTGMSLSFSGIEIKIMCTHEDVYPNKFVDGNDTSTVYRVDIGEQRVLFLGDCRDRECDAMLKAFGDSGELRSDIVQWSHHGYEGATKELYEAVNAPTILWPMNIVGWQDNYKTVPQNVFDFWFTRTDRPAKDYIAENLANGKIKKVIVAGAGAAALEFPYTPVGEVILDWHEFFEEHKHEVPKGYELVGYRYCDNDKNKIEKIN